MPECPQVLRAHDINHYYGEEASSEDCLYLNVWAPAGSGATSKLPVIVYIYGGGFTIGSAGIPTYGGEVHRAARRGLRQLQLPRGDPGLSRPPGAYPGSRAAHSGNYGLLDQALALRWIHDNIARFGGDPQRILIVGQSAGAGSVALQLFSPLSRGLFSRAMMSSGCNWMAPTPSLAQGEHNGELIQSYLHAADLEALRNIPADRLVAAQLEGQIGVTVTTGVRAGPVIDGYFLPRTPLEMLEGGEGSDVPIIASFNKDESVSPLMGAHSVEEYRDIAAADVWGEPRAISWGCTRCAAPRRFAPSAARWPARGAWRAVREPAPSCRPATTTPRPTWICSPGITRLPPACTSPTTTWPPPAPITRRISRSGSALWMPSICSAGPASGAPDDYELSGLMMDALVAFAATGDPSSSSVRWPAWSADHEVMLEWGGAQQAEVVLAECAGN